jgi:hypothetical protein
VADLFTLREVEAGPLSTFTSREEAEEELAAILRDEPDWLGDVWVESFELVVAEP